jgi:hypothetical protein
MNKIIIKKAIALVLYIIGITLLIIYANWQVAIAVWALLSANNIERILK